jgi:hypothetical protein
MRKKKRVIPAPTEAASGSSGEGVSSDSWQPIGYIKEDNYSD